MSIYRLYIALVLNTTFLNVGLHTHTPTHAHTNAHEDACEHMSKEITKDDVMTRALLDNNRDQAMAMLANGKYERAAEMLTSVT